MLDYQVQFADFRSIFFRAAQAPPPVQFGRLAQTIRKIKL